MLDKNPFFGQKLFTHMVRVIRTFFRRFSSSGFAAHPCIQILNIRTIKIRTKAFTEKLNESRSEIESSLQMWLPKEKWPELERVLINILSE